MKKPQTYIFLLDSLGALVSTFCLGGILIYQPIFGLNPDWIKVFIVIAILLCLYGASRHFMQPNNWRKQLKLLAVLNLVYSLLTLTVLFVDIANITLWGWIYFISEILIVVILALWEYRIATKDPA